MSLSVNAKTYTADSFSANAVQYNGPAKTLTIKDDIVLKKTSPKPTSLFSGVSRANLKLTRTLTLTGALTPTGEAILEVSLSVPVGASSANVNTMIDDVGAWLASTPAESWAMVPQISF